MRILTSLLVVALAAPSAVQAEDDIVEAGDEDVTVTSNSGPPPKTLAERIPAVTRRVFAKEGRLAVVGGLGTTFNDPFYDHVSPEIGLAYHLSESFWIGVAATYHAAIQNKQAIVSTVEIPQASLNGPQYAARLEAAWVPFYGKLSLLAERVLHFDTYLAAGVGYVGARDSGGTLAGTVGIGEHVFLNDVLALRFEVRDHIFRMSRAPGTSEKSLQNFLSVSVGVAFFFPSSSESEAP